MLYTGNTLREALGKALGTRDQYGRKIERRTYGKQEAEPRYPYDDPQRIATARQNALARARNFIDQADHTARNETGILFVYDKQTGLTIRHDPDAQSFHHVAFDLGAYRSEPDRYAMLAHAHTHVKSRARDFHTRTREDNDNEGWSGDDRNHLLDFAAGYLKTPHGHILSGGTPPFSPLSEHPQLK